VLNLFTSRGSEPRIVYVDPDEPETPPALLPTGEAGLLVLAADGRLDVEPRVALSPNSVHALTGHGVIDALNRLPVEGALGGGAPAVLPPAVLDDVRRVLYDAERNTYGRTWEFVLDRTGDPEPVEYRARIANREYQVTLLRLIDLAGLASREGHAVWIRI
jgi:hypothetical protein